MFVKWEYWNIYFHLAWFFGDPHITTLDGHQYTFNGYGEYTMMRINKETGFELQARTDLATNENGTTINATIFSAFAAEDHTGARVQVAMSRKRDSKTNSVTNLEQKWITLHMYWHDW